MGAATVAGVYAEALLALSDERGKRTAVVESCRQLIDALDAEAIAQLDDPRLGKARALEALKAALGGKLEAEVLDLLLLLVERNRLADAPLIMGEAVRIAEAEVGLVRVQVTTAAPLSGPGRETLSASLKRIFGPGTLIAMSSDPALIGGLTVRNGDLLVDGSVRRHLAEIENRFLSIPLTDRLWDL
jgi:F-type H+-transporting ATPase subunit delta